LPHIRAAVKALDVPWIKENEDGFVKVYYQAKNRAIADINRIATVWTDGDGQSYLDPTNNSAMRREEPYRGGEFLLACQAVDVPASQMMLEGAIYEVNALNDLKLGLDYIAWKNGPGRNLFNIIIGAQTSHEDAHNMSSIYSPFSPRTAVTGDLVTSFSQCYSSLNILVTAAYMDFLASKGKARVVARPKIVARSAQPATFTATDQLLAFAIAPDQFTRTPLVSNSDIGVDNRTLNYSLSALQTGVALTVTPFIGLDSSEVSVTATFRTLAGTTPQGTPIVNTRMLTTRARVADGQPLILGGLTREEEVDSYAGAPWISRIPVLGLLFGGETHSNRTTEVIIVLTPRVTVGADSDLYEAEDTQAKATVLGKTDVKLPESSWGFDQWLLDKSN